MVFRSEYARVAERELLSSQRRPATPVAGGRGSSGASDRGGSRVSVDWE